MKIYLYILYDISYYQGQILKTKIGKKVFGKNFDKLQTSRHTFEAARFSYSALQQNQWCLIFESKTLKRPF